MLLRAECHPNADLAAALSHRIRRDASQPNQPESNRTPPIRPYVQDAAWSADMNCTICSAMLRALHVRSESMAEISRRTAVITSAPGTARSINVTPRREGCE